MSRYLYKKIQNISPESLNFQHSGLKLTTLGTDGLRNIWHNAKLRGRGYSRAHEIVSCAEKSVGLTDGIDAGREAMKWYAGQILKLDVQLACKFCSNGTPILKSAVHSF